MPLIVPIDEIYYYVIQPLNLGGLTETTNATGINNALVDLDDEGEIKFLKKTKGVENYRPLPNSGYVQANEIYGCGVGLCIVRQSHNRTGNPPASEPLFFMVYDKDKTGVEWIVSESIKKGSKRTYLGNIYKCLISHITSGDILPPSSPAYWELK
jgi:hypothetical protein